jgi:CheY-like chemotaxis protein
MDTPKKHSIFIVDDDHFLLTLYSIKFKNAGFDVTTASNGEEAISKLKTGFIPEIMLIDMIMPGIDGLETLSRIRNEKLAPTTKVIVLTNQDQPQDIERARSFDIVGYIVKATTIPSEIVTEVNNVLSGHPITKDRTLISK